MTDMKVVTFGEIMLRLAAPGHLRFGQTRDFSATFGGAEANVAVSLANYGIPVAFVTRLPENDIARSCVADLRGYGVDTRASKVIYDRAHSSMSEIRPGMVDWDRVFSGAGWFHWTGITPAISESAAMACLEAIRAARKAGLTVSCDLNYRKNLWKYGKSASEVMPELVENCDIILGNEEDAWTVFGIRPEGFDARNGNVEASSFESVCRQLKDRFPRASRIAVTLRGSVSASHNTWSGVLFDGRNFFRSRQYDITHIVDRVGGGDSFMGGLIYGLLTYKGDDGKALEFATAASCLKHTIYGDYNQVTVSEVEKLMGGDASGRVAR